MKISKEALEKIQPKLEQVEKMRRANLNKVNWEYFDKILDEGRKSNQEFLETLKKIARDYKPKE